MKCMKCMREMATWVELALSQVQEAEDILILTLKIKFSTICQKGV